MDDNECRHQYSDIVDIYNEHYTVDTAEYINVCTVQISVMVQTNILILEVYLDA